MTINRDISYLEASSKALVTQDVEEYSSNSIWKEVCQKLRSLLGSDVHKAWTGKLEYLGKDQETTSEDNNDKVIRLKSPSRFIGETIKDRYLSYVREAFEDVGIIGTNIVLNIPVAREQSI